MKKKLSLIAFTLIISFVLIGKVLGAKEYWCDYEIGEGKMPEKTYELQYTSEKKKITMQNSLICYSSSIKQILDYKFDDNGNKLENDGYCPSSINIDEAAGKFTWITKSEGEYKLFRKENHDDGKYSCYYSLNPTLIQIKYRVTKELRIEMIDCVSVYDDDRKYNCMNYNFEDNEWPLTTEDVCPSSVNFDWYTGTITWIGKYKGEYPTDQKVGEGITEVSDVCTELTTSTSCKTAKGIACVWVEDEDAPGDQGGYCNVDNLQYVYCGDGARDIPTFVPYIISFAVNLLKIATPIILIIVSIISLLKALASSKEDEIKKAQSGLIRKMIAAAMVFFVISIVQFVILKVANTDEEADGFSSCLSCFLNNDCAESTYYKTSMYGTTYCTDLKSGDREICPEDDK